MQDDHTAGTGGTELETPIRNHYFYGQLLGVQQFELETEYGIGQLRLVSRLIFGYGVVCGLAVDLSDDGTQVRVAPGVAIDKRGRLIVVPDRTPWIPIPADLFREARERADNTREEPCVQVLICYHECRGDPVVVHAGDCGSPDPCAPSTIRERYRIEFRSRCARRPQLECGMPDLITRGDLDYEQLARWVTEQRRCTRVPGDPCITLANLRLADEDEHRCRPDGVDNWVRPIVASNVVLMELVKALLEELERRYEYE
jgi:hypothetical protein